MTVGLVLAVPMLLSAGGARARPEAAASVVRSQFDREHQRSLFVNETPTASNPKVMGRLAVRGRLAVGGWIATLVMGLVALGFFLI